MGQFLKRYKYWLIIASCFLLVGLYLYILNEGSKPGATRANFSKITEGMTQEEVEAILGKPTNVHSDKLSWLEGDDSQPIRGRRLLLVRFDKSGKVSETAVFVMQPDIIQQAYDWVNGGYRTRPVLKK
jgi:hypothetical protein